MIFKSSYDTTTKVVTTITLLILVFVTIAPATSMDWGTHKLYYILIPTIILLFLGAIAFAPKFYAMEDDEIRIHRMLLKPVQIKISNIASIEILAKQQLKGSIRLFGSGAFLGYYGWFINKRIGKAMWYATRLDRTILILTHNGRKFLISPDEIDLFVGQLPNSLISKQSSVKNT